MRVICKEDGLKGLKPSGPSDCRLRRDLICLDLAPPVSSPKNEGANQGQTLIVPKRGSLWLQPGAPVKFAQSEWLNYPEITGSTANNRKADSPN